MAKAEHMKGVSVVARTGARGTTYGARYTLRDGKRPLVKPPAAGWADWQQAFDAACAAQRSENLRTDTHGGQLMTVNSLIEEFYLPEHQADVAVPHRTRQSHLGDGTGQAKAMGRKNTLGAKFAIRYVFGHHRLCDLNRQQIVEWQNEMVSSGAYKVSSIKAKRDLLRAILQITVVNGWLPLNYANSVRQPREVVTEEPGLEPHHWALLRSRLSGEVTRLFVEVTLESGLRKGESSGLRAMDVMSPNDKEPAPHLHVRQKISWPGLKEVAAERERLGLPPDPEPKRYTIDDYLKMNKPGRRLALSEPMYLRLGAHIERFNLLPEDLLFDYGILRVEHKLAREVDPLPTEFPVGRYVNAAGRSGEHGQQNTYSYGCRCPFCTRAYSEYRFWWARKRGRKAAAPWLEDGFLESRAGNTTPLDLHWFDRAVWKRATGELGYDWTLHDLRHAMITWAVEAGVPLQVIQQDAGHSHATTTEAQQEPAPPAPRTAPAPEPDPPQTNLPDPAVALVLADPNLTPVEKAAILRALCPPCGPGARPGNERRTPRTSSPSAGAPGHRRSAAPRGRTA